MSVRFDTENAHVFFVLILVLRHDSVHALWVTDLITLTAFFTDDILTWWEKRGEDNGFTVFQDLQISRDSVGEPDTSTMKLKKLNRTRIYAHGFFADTF